MQRRRQRIIEEERREQRRSSACAFTFDFLFHLALGLYALVYSYLDVNASGLGEVLRLHTKLGLALIIASAFFCFMSLRALITMIAIAACSK